MIFVRDLHSHYLPGVDDGAKDIEVTKRMLKSAQENGITDIIFTPHFILDSKYMSTKEENKKIFAPIKNMAKEEFGINVFLGNEVYCTNEIMRLYKEGLISTLNDSRYMLIEIPMYSKMNNVKDIFFELISNDIVPILAHPERYTAYYNDVNFFMELKNMGVLLQINYPSLVGEYGSKAKKMAVKLLKQGLISFVGSDIHSDREPKNEQVVKMEKKLKKIVGESEFIEITANNFARVVRNDDIL